MATVVKPRILELSEAAYKEIEGKLIAGGYDFLIWQNTYYRDGILMDGFMIRCELDEHRPSP